MQAQADSFTDLGLTRAIDSVSAALTAIREGDEPRMTDGARAPARRPPATRPWPRGVRPAPRAGRACVGGQARSAGRRR